MPVFSKLLSKNTDVKIYGIYHVFTVKPCHPEHDGTMEMYRVIKRFKALRVKFQRNDDLDLSMTLLF